jgi:hypothetical protein
MIRERLMQQAIREPMWQAGQQEMIAQGTTMAQLQHAASVPGGLVFSCGGLDYNTLTHSVNTHLCSSRLSALSSQGTHFPDSP